VTDMLRLKRCEGVARSLNCTPVFADMRLIDALVLDFNIYRSCINSQD